MTNHSDPDLASGSNQLSSASLCCVHSRPHHSPSPVLIVNNPLDPDIPKLPNDRSGSRRPSRIGKRLKPDGCRYAYGLMNGRLAYCSQVWMFWSRLWVVQPEYDNWELPFGTNYSGFHLPHSSRNLPILLNVAQGRAPS